jgi:hypothetical protein
MCMMCEEDAIYSAYLEWKARKDEEAARQAAAPPLPAEPSRAEPASAPRPSKPSFTCD